MNDYKNKRVLMAAAYIIMILCFASAAFSGIVVADNLSNQYYSSGANACDDIRLMCMDRAYDDISGYIGSGEFDEYDSDGNPTGYLKKELSDEELVSGENKSDVFAYTIRNGKDVIKRVNPDLIKAYDSGSSDIAEHTYHISDYEGDCKIDIYVGDIRSGGLPESLQKTAVPLMKMYEYRIPAAVILVIGSAAALILLVILMVSAYRKKSGRYLRYIPLDISAAAAAVIVAAAVSVAFSFDITNIDALFASFTVCTAISSLAVTGWLILFAARAGQGRWWRSTAVYFVVAKAAGWIISRSAAVIRGLPLVWKTVLIYMAGALVNLVIMLTALTYPYSPAIPFIMWIVGFAVTGRFVYITVTSLKTIKMGAEHIAAGEFEYRIDEKGMYHDIKEHAETLNNIGKGLSAAVDEKMKSERMKTALITNVSHDIKTPLTSIINYVDLLQKEELDNDNASEYIKVLERQSQRLRRLIDDLTEASKTSTGNIELDMSPCDVGVMMSQLMGEYKEKAEKAELTMLMDIPKEPVMIMADGRRLWRVLDNLMNNICKYSLPGSRVYQNLAAENGKAVLTYRNISKYELDISPDELTGRFVRGDRSRHTEGSGLGLSIAEDLTKLQGGTFSIDTDGDLFKVTLTFDTI